MRRFVGKIIYYSDVSLHLRIIAAMISVSSSKFIGYYHAIPVTVLPHHKSSNPLHVNRLRHYSLLWLKLRTRFGFDDACYYRSALMCTVFRRSGIDARLNFGTKKEEVTSDIDWHFSGHCWVSYGQEKIQTAYSFLIQYPSEGSL